MIRQQKYNVSELCEKAEGSIFTSQKCHHLEGGSTRSKSHPGELCRGLNVITANNPAWLFKTPLAASCYRRCSAPFGFCIIIFSSSVCIWLSLSMLHFGFFEALREQINMFSPSSFGIFGKSENMVSIQRVNNLVDPSLRALAQSYHPDLSYILM